MSLCSDALICGREERGGERGKERKEKERK